MEYSSGCGVSVRQDRCSVRCQRVHKRQETTVWCRSMPGAAAQRPARPTLTRPPASQGTSFLWARCQDSLISFLRFSCSSRRRFRGWGEMGREQETLVTPLLAQPPGGSPPA